MAHASAEPEGAWVGTGPARDRAASVAVLREGRDRWALARVDQFGVTLRGIKEERGDCNECGTTIGDHGN